MPKIDSARGGWTGEILRIGLFSPVFAADSSPAQHSAERVRRRVHTLRQNISSFRCLKLSTRDSGHDQGFPPARSKDFPSRWFVCLALLLSCS
jgi:hypothetical protein